MTSSLFDQGLRSARMQAYSTHIFTLTFPAGEIAILEVRGATNRGQACDLAERALPQCRYSVSDGDQTHGYAHCFYLWSEGKAQI